MCKKDNSFRGKRDHALLRLYMSTGARRSELCNLAIDEGGFSLIERRRIEVPRTSGGNPERSSGYIDYDRKQIVLVNTKTKRPRILNIDPDTMRSIGRYVRERQKHTKSSLPWLWLSHSGRKRFSDSGRLTPGGVNQMLDRRLDEAGLPHIGPHSLRHSWVHHQLSGGMGEVNVAELAGWSPTSAHNMLARYGAVMRRDRALEADRDHGFGSRL